MARRRTKRTKRTRRKSTMRSTLERSLRKTIERSIRKSLKKLTNRKTKNIGFPWFSVVFRFFHSKSKSEISNRFRFSFTCQLLCFLFPTYRTATRLLLVIIKWAQRQKQRKMVLQNLLNL